MFCQRVRCEDYSTGRQTEVSIDSVCAQQRRAPAAKSQTAYKAEKQPKKQKVALELRVLLTSHYHLWAENFISAVRGSKMKPNCFY